MQDSLKDYIKIASNVHETKTKLSQEAITSVIATAEHKKHSEDYAQKVVEFLIDGKLKPQIFTKSLNFINIALYDDVVEERSISKLCGYPLCGKHIPEMPHKKYVILAKVNKVFDITDRKNFCSNFCYKASSHIKNQIDDSPLWLRQTENAPAKQYDLLEKTSSGLTPGEEISYHLANDAENKNEAEAKFTSVSAFTEACLDEAETLENIQFDESDENEEFNVKFEPSQEGDKQVKSILKKRKSDETLIEDTNHIKIQKSVDDFPIASTSDEKLYKGPRKVAFIDEEIPSTSLTDELELNRSIQSICKTLDIKLNLNEPKTLKNLADKNNLLENDNINIDLDKMKKVIEKVNISENLRKKPAIQINTWTNPEVHVKNANIYSSANVTKELEQPIYSQRMIEKLKTMKTSETRNGSVESHKKTIVNENYKNDEKMARLMEKLKKKNTDEKKRVILIDTVENPDIARTNLEITLKKQKLQQQHQLQESKTLDLQENELEDIKKAFKSWLTLEVFIHLHGKDTIQMLLNKEKLTECFDKLKISCDVEGSDKATLQQGKYAEICKKLDLKEWADMQFDRNCASTSTTTAAYQDSTTLKQALKPLPDYSQLQDEVKQMNTKVNAFYSGEVVAKSKALNKSRAESAKEKEEKSEIEEMVEEPVMPLVDLSSQHAMRRNIFNKSITKFVQNHIFELSLDETISEKVLDLAKHFKLEANNIVFKPSQWNIISLILIDCLKLSKNEKNSSFKELLETDEAKCYVKNCFHKFTNVKHELFLKEIHQLVTIDNVDQFVNNYIKQ